MARAITMPAAPGQALDEPKENQEPCRWCDRAEQGHDHVSRDANQQWPAAPETITERPGDNLTEREPDEASGEGQLDDGLIGRQLACDRREGREIYIDRERPEGRQAAQQYEQAQALNASQVRGIAGSP